MNNIVVYGPGCAKCTALADVTKQAMQELHLDASLEKVTDAMQFAVAGVLVTPALAVDGKVFVSGRVPSKDEIKKILQETIQADSSRQKSCCCSGVAESALRLGRLLSKFQNLASREMCRLMYLIRRFFVSRNIRG